MTDFEFIEINDANAVARKVAGEFETQGADDLFHQTSRNLNTRLEEGLNVTLSDSTPTVIELNGMESHVLLDIGGQMDNGVEIKLRYFAGGPLYPADWEKLIPHRMKGGGHDFSWFPTANDGYIDSDDEGSDNSTGGHVFLIPTRGAVECVITLYGSSVTKTGVNWARIVMADNPIQHVIAKNTRAYSSNSVNVPTGEASYAAGDWLGDTAELTTGETAPGTPGPDQIMILRSLSIVGRSFGSPTTFGDIDVLLTSSNTFSVVDGAAAALFGNIGASGLVAVLSFRATPGEGEYKLHSVNGEPAANAFDLNIPIPRPTGPNGNDAIFCYASVIAVDAIAGPEVGANGFDIGYTLDWG